MTSGGGLKPPSAATTLRSVVDVWLPDLPLRILALGALLRILGTGAAALWFDEANTLYRADIPFLTLFSEHSERSGDLLLELILRPLLRLSHSVWMLRLPSLLASLACLWLVYKLMQRLSFTLPQQICASLFIAFLPGLLWMAQDARSYSLLSLLFLAALWFALESQWLGLLAACGLMVYTHNTSPLLAATVLAVALYLFPWKRRRIVLVGLGAFVAWIPAIYRMLDYWIIQQPWQPVLTFNWTVYSVLQCFWPIVWKGPFQLVAFCTIILTWFLLLSTVKVRSRVVLLIAWGMPGMLIIAACWLLKSNILNYRTLMPLLYPFGLWLGWELGTRRLTVFLPRLVWAGMLLAGLVLWQPAYRGAQLDQVAADIRSQWRTGDQLVYTTVTVGLPFDYYLSDLPHTWNDIVQDPLFMNMPTIKRTASPGIVPDRLWVIIPVESILITPQEWTLLDELVQHQPPVKTLYYLQTAPINVYLVEEP